MLEYWFVQETVATISRVQAEAGVSELSLLNFVVSDGATMVATRYSSSPTQEPASLYYAQGAAFVRHADTSNTNHSTHSAAASSIKSARATSVVGNSSPTLAMHIRILLDTKPELHAFCFT